MESDQRLERLEQQMERILTHLENPPRTEHPPAGQVNPPENPPPGPVVTEVRVRDFQKLKPLTFPGGLDPVKANEWLESIEKISQVMLCEGREKVALAAYNLTGEAQRWWTLVKKTEPQMVWERFYEVFNQKYIPPSIKDSKSMEFQNLKQKSGMTVAQYEAEFTTLAHYAPHLIPDDNMKARRFEDGLDPELRKIIKSLKLPTYAEVLDRALMLERENAIADQVRESKKRKNGEHNSGNGQSKRQNTGGQDQNQNKNEDRPSCLNCGRSHIGICLKGSNGCYGCGEPGHIRKNCPRNSNTNQQKDRNHGAQQNNQKQVGNTGQGLRQGRAYAIIPDNMRNMVAGTLLSCILLDLARFLDICKFGGPNFLRWGECNTPTQNFIRKLEKYMAKM